MQSILIDKIKHDLRGAREEVEDAQRGTITMFNEQKRYELNIQRLQVRCPSGAHINGEDEDRGSESEDEDSRAAG